MAGYMKGCSIVNLGGDGLVILGAQDFSFQDLQVYAKSPGDPYAGSGARRNWPCPCGSGKKYKRCHEGAKKVATGIKSINSSARFDDTKVVSDGVGIHLENDNSTFTRTVVIAGEKVDYVALAKAWGLPENVPIQDLEEAVLDVKQSKNPAVLETSKLKLWLTNNGFNMACWAQIALSIITYCFAPT